MILEFDQTAAIALLACDIVVVGGGPIGISMAVQLARTGHEVVVLEAGGKTVEPAAQTLNAAINDGHPPATVPQRLPRVRSKSVRLAFS
jgi:NADPH-dependent 2,4-dienoyl-CoA reductase/sulfur reductase-like enzyme